MLTPQAQNMFFSVEANALGTLVWSWPWVISLTLCTRLIWGDVIDYHSRTKRRAVKETRECLSTWWFASQDSGNISIGIREKSSGYISASPPASWRDVTREVCWKNALSSKPPRVTRIARIGLGTRLDTSLTGEMKTASSRHILRLWSLCFSHLSFVMIGRRYRTEQPALTCLVGLERNVIRLG